MTYKRKFIILKKGYQNTQGNAKGHCKLEMRGVKGIVTLNIENVERENYYKVALLANDKEASTWNLGKVFTDDVGKGKGEYSFTKRELESNNFPLSKLSAIIILEEDKIVLGGYIDKDDGSINRYINTLSNLEPDVQQDRLYPQDDIEDDFKPYFQGEDEELKIEKTDDIEETDDTEEREIHIDENKEEMQTEQYSQEDLIETTEEIENLEERYDDDIPESSEDKMQEEDSEKLEHIREVNRKNQTTMYVLSILRFFPYIEPFEYSLQGFNWWIVEMEKENEYKPFLPYFAHISGGNKKDIYSDDITCKELMVKYKHYLFGLYNEGEKVKYYVYGIPGKFTQEEHPNAGRDGFNTWYKGKDEIGYWLVFIDPMRGKPVYPEIPMIPID